MKKTVFVRLLLSALFLGSFDVGWAQNISTFAGGGAGGDGSAASTASLSSPNGVAIDGSGNVFIVDENAHKIRKINTSGVISTFAGNGTAGYSGDGGAATAAKLQYPHAVAVDGTGNVFIADGDNHCIRKVNSSGIISTVAGNGTGSFSGDGGAATAATLKYPWGIAVDAGGNLYIADESNHKIRKVNTTGIISTIAGSASGGGYSGDGGAATAAQILSPRGVAVDDSGNVFITDLYNSRIRKINTSGIISTYAGTGTAGNTGDGSAATAAKLNRPFGIAIDGSGNIYIGDESNHNVRKVSASGIITTISGTGTAGLSGDGGAATAATLSGPRGLAVDGPGNVFIADYSNGRIRRVSCSVPTVAAISGASIVATGSNTTLTNGVSGGTWSSSNTSVATISSGGVVTGLSAGTVMITYSASNACGTAFDTASLTVSCGGFITTYAGTGVGGYGGEGGAATASLVFSNDLAIDASGNIYTVEAIEHRIYKISFSGIVTTFAGTGVSGFSGDGGAATAAKISYPVGVGTDNNGNVYIADGGNYRIRKVDASGIITTIAGTGVSGSSGDGGAATAAQLADPADVAADDAGNIYIADETNSTIRKISPSGIITRFAGTGSNGYSGDGGAATSAALYSPRGVVVDAGGNVFITDLYNNRVRKVNTSGIISTVAGSGAAGYSGDGGAATAANLEQPWSATVDGSGNLYFTEWTNGTVRKVTPSGIISTIAGNGTWGYSGDGGVATAANLQGPRGIAIDRSGNVYFSDYQNRRIRMVSSGLPTVLSITGASSVCAGSTITLTDATSGGTWSTSDSTIATVSLGGVVTGLSGGTATITYSVSNTCGTAAATKTVTVNQVLATGYIINTIAGTGTSGFGGDGGAATAAMLKNPHGVTTDASGNIYIADQYNGRIRKISPSGTITTIAGNGSYGFGGDGGAATAATLTYTEDVAVDAIGNVYFADFYNNRIRKIDTSGNIATIAGDGTLGYSGDGGAATAASISHAIGVAVDGIGNVYISDYGNNRVRKVNTSGIISTIAGTGTAGYSGDGGAATAAELNFVQDVAVDGNGNIYVVDAGNYRIRKINSSGIITTVAGDGTYGYSGDGGLATAAQIKETRGLSVDGHGNIFFVAGWSVVRKIDAAGIITTIAGSDGDGFSGDGGPATAAYLRGPRDVAVDGYGNLYVADFDNHRIRKLTPSLDPISGDTAVCVGASTTFTHSLPGGAWSSSAPSVASVSTTGAVYGVSAGTATVTYAASNACGTAISTQHITVSNSPSVSVTPASVAICIGGTTGMSASGATTYSWSPSADLSNNTGAAVVFSGTTTTIFTLTGTNPGCAASTAIATVTVSPVLATGYKIDRYAGTPGSSVSSGDGGVALAASTEPFGITIDGSGNLYFAEWGNHKVRKITASGVISTVAGGAGFGFSGDGGAATAAALNHPWDVAVDQTGNIYIADSYYPRIRKVDTNGVITTIAGNGTAGYSGDGGPATAAMLGSGGSLNFDATGNLYYADGSNNTIRKVSTSGSITTVAGTGTAGYSGDGGPATAAQLNIPSDVLFDASGNMYISEYGNHTIRKVSTTGIITTIAGTGTLGYSGDGGAATATALNTPGEMGFDASGNLIYTEQGYPRLRMVTTSGTIRTIAGTGYGAYSGDGGPSTAAQIQYPYGVAIDGSGNIYMSANALIRKLTPSLDPISGDTAVCVGASTTFTHSLSGGTWSSSVPSVASVSTTGEVYGLSGGTSTITYAASNACGTAIATKVVKIDSGIFWPAGITGSSSVCTGSTITLATTTTGGMWSVDSTALASITSGGAVTGTAYGTATVSYSVTNSCGTGYSLKWLTIIPTPGPGVITAPASLCLGGTTTVTDAISGGTWASTNPSVASISSTGVVTAMSAGTTGIVYFMFNACGAAFHTASLDVVSPTVAAITGTTSVCSGATTTLASATTGGAWTTSSASVASVSSTGVVTGLSAGTATISYSVTNTCGTNAATTNVTVTTTPSAAGSITGTTTVCAGSTTTLADSVSGGSWSSGSPTVASVSTTGVVTGIASGTTNISYTISNSCGSVTHTASVSVVSPTVGAISGATAVCTGSTITLTNATTGGTWTTSNASVASVTSTGVVTGLSAGAATISYSVTNACGTNAATTNVTVTTLSAGTISGATSLCQYDSILLASSVTGGHWGVIDATVATISATGRVTGIAAGSTGIYYAVSNSCGTASASISISVNGAPLAGSISGASTLCVGSSTTMSSTATGGTWSNIPPTRATITTAGILTGLSAGADTVYYTVTNGCGTSRASTIVAIISVPTAGTLSTVTGLTPGATATITSTVSGGTWSLNNYVRASISTGGVITGLSAGSDSAIYTVTNSCGSVRAYRSFSVTGATGAGTISGPSAVCIGSTITLTSTVSGGTWSSSYAPVASVVSTSGVVRGNAVGIIAVTYTVGTSTSTFPVTVNSTSVSAIAGATSVCPGASTTFTDVTAGGSWSNVTPARGSIVASTGVYTGISSGADSVVYTVVNACGTLIVKKAVTVTSAPSAGSISGGASAICVGVSTLSTNSTTGGVWAFSNPTVATIAAIASPSVTVTGMSAGIDTLSYTVTGACGLSSTIRKVITVNPLPTVGAGATSSMIIGASATLTNTVSGGVWSTVYPTIASVNATTGAVRARAAGLDTIKYKVTNTCGTATAIYLVTVTASKPGTTDMELASANDIQVYPNPSNGVLTISLTGDFGTTNHTIRVSDATGRLVLEQQEATDKFTIDLSNQASGMYLLRIVTGSQVHEVKVVKE